VTQNLARATRATLVAILASTALISAASTASAGSPCATATIAGDYCYTDDGSVATIVGYIGAGGDLVIPDTLGTLPVTVVAMNVFASAGLTSVTLPASLKTIGQSAFQNNSITTLDVPDSVTSIGADAFVNNSIATLRLGDSVASIGMWAFANNSFTDLTLPASVTSIGDMAFRLFTLKTITMLGNEPSALGESVFGPVDAGNDPLVMFHLGAIFTAGATGYWSTPGAEYRLQTKATVSFSSGYSAVPAPVVLVIWDSLEAITSGSLADPGTPTAGGWHFNGWFAAPEGGEALSFPQTITADTVLYAQWTRLPCGLATRNGDYCYTETGGNATITGYVGAGGALTIPGTLDDFPVTAIGANAFDGSSLSAVSLPNSVTTIGDLAFFDNDISTLTLGDSVTTIGGGAFHSNSLTHVTIPASVQNLGAIAFGNNRLTSVTMEGNEPTSLGLGVFGAVAGLNDPVVSFPLGATYTHNVPEVWSANGTNYRVLVPVTATFSSPVGTAPAPVALAIGDTLPNPGPLTADTHRFEGWYDAPTGGNLITFPLTVAADTAIYAQWEARDVVAPANAGAGSSITVTGTGFEPGESVAIELHSTPVLLGTVIANSSGAISGTFTIPASAPEGSHSLVLTGSVTGVSSGGITIGGPLAFTGTNPVPLGLGAVALVGIGIGLILRRRASR